MNWNELEVIWRRQEVPSTTTDIDEIKKTFEQRHRKLRTNLLVRNMAEGGTGLVMTPVMVYVWMHYGKAGWPLGITTRSEEHTSELQSPCNLVWRLLLEQKKKIQSDL